MYLKSIELQGFKSFPDKTVLHFHKGITAVVGPNGSGKSNVSDAVRWVLGEQSTKTLRGSRMEDVIFSGTAERRAQGFAQVTLVLDNTDRQIDFDKDELSIARRYYRSGESEYIIDGATVRLRDINELFMDTGLGRDGYSIISQGKIADIISSKSNERREIFEEAAGISKYRYRRQDAQRKLAQAEENMVRLLDILDELSSRVGPLKTQSDKAEKFLVLAEEKKNLEIGLWLDLITKSNDKLREQEKKITLASAQYEQCEEALEKIEKENEEIYAKNADSNLVIETLRGNAAGFEEEAIRKESEIELANQTIEHNQSTIERIRAEAAQAGDTEEMIDGQIAQKQAEIDTLGETIAAQRAALEEQSRGMQALMNENEEFTKQFSAYTGQLADLQLALSDAKVEKSTALSGAEQITLRQSDVDSALAQKRAALEKAQSEKEECAAHLKHCEDTVQGYRNTLEGYDLKYVSDKNKALKLKTECDRLNAESYNKNQKLAMLKELQKNMEGYSGAVKAVIRHARHGVLRGVHGALADLIQTEEAYSLAVETALGNALQNVVTGTQNDAKRAIEYLKSNNLGRVTFLPIAALEPRSLEQKGLENCEGFVDYATNLVSCDKQYKNIIANLLGKTVVAEDLETAILIARQYHYAFKIVTLDGQLINTGGSMTGGSKAKNTGMLSRATEIAALEKECEALKQQAEQAFEKSNAAAQALAKIEAEMEAVRADIISGGEDVIRTRGELNLIEEQCTAAAEALAQLQSEKDSALERIEQFRAQARQADEKMAALEQEIAHIEEGIESINADKEKLESKRAELNETANAVNIKIAEAGKDIAAKRETIQSLTLQKLSQAQRAAKTAEEIAAIEKGNDALRETIAAAAESCDALRQKAAQAKENIEAIIHSRSDLEKRSTELRAAEKDYTSQREKLSGEMARLSERKLNMQNEYETTVAKLFDEYELTRSQAEQLDIKIENIGEAQRNLSSVKAKIRALGSVNVAAIEEYREVKERYDFLSLQLEDVQKSERELSKLIKELTNNMSAQFTAQFAKINKEFGETMQEFFGGGKAALQLEDEENVLECGIEIKVQPPGKNVQNIALLSGGEKSLAAVALLFAILKVTPAPFCIYDEVEAALDDVNVDKFAKYMRKMCAHIQFIAITHRRGTMEEADVLYGVTMQEKGVSKLLELQANEISKKLGI
ncbi:MAG: chromosome segregation protein SMC [Clostridia bacterium]|nr:chromosome segregation protein SMC [Clostridia bacterium]